MKKHYKNIFTNFTQMVFIKPKVIITLIIFIPYWLGATNAKLFPITNDGATNAAAEPILKTNILWAQSTNQATNQATNSNDLDIATLRQQLLAAKKTDDAAYLRAAFSLGLATIDKYKNTLRLNYGFFVDGGYQIKNVQLGGGLGLQILISDNLNKTAGDEIAERYHVPAVSNLQDRTYQLQNYWLPIYAGVAYKLELGTPKIALTPGLYGGLLLDISSWDYTDTERLFGTSITKNITSITYVHGLVMPSLEFNIGLNDGSSIIVGGRVYYVPSGDRDPATLIAVPPFFGSIHIGWQGYF